MKKAKPVEKLGRKIAGPEKKDSRVALNDIKRRPGFIFGSTGTGVILTPSTGINVVNKINLLRNPLLIYQYFNNGIKNKKIGLFDFGVTACKATNK